MHHSNFQAIEVRFVAAAFPGSYFLSLFSVPPAAAVLADTESPHSFLSFVVPKAQRLASWRFTVVIPLAEAFVSDAIRLEVQLSALGTQTALVAWHLSAWFSILAVASVTIAASRHVKLGGSIVLLADLLASLQAAVGHRRHVPCSCYGWHLHLLLLAATTAPPARKRAAGQGEHRAGQGEKDMDQSCSRCRLHACLGAVGGCEGFECRGCEEHLLLCAYIRAIWGPLSLIASLKK